MKIQRLSLPIALYSTQCFLILEYVEDNLIIIEGYQQLIVLNDILQKFAKSIGLRVNLSMSMMVPVNIFEERLHVLANGFGVSDGSLPFTYLGLSLGLTKLKVEGFWPLVSRSERRLVSTLWDRMAIRGVNGSR